MRGFAVPVLTVLVAGVLAACGGSDSTSSPAAQAKQMVRSQKASATAADYATVVQELYVAYFGRPADPNGLVNFENALQNAGAPTDITGLAQAYSSNQAVKTLIDSFGTSKESQTLYGAGSTEDFVKAVFQNVLGRQPASSGLSYWSGAISSGSLSQSDAALAIMSGAATNSSHSSQGQTDQTLVNNRLSVAANFTAQVSTQNAVTYYSGSAAAQSARNMLALVDSTTIVTSFQSTVASTVSSLQSLVGVCTSSNLSLANYDAVSLGMSLAQVNAQLGCQPTSALTVRGDGYVAYDWTDNVGQSISVDFDGAGTTVTGLEGTTVFKASTGINGSAPSGAVCTSANFTTAIYNSITIGMTLAQVDQAIGCDNNPTLTIRGDGYVAYDWTTNLGQSISVDFDSTGTIVAGLEGTTVFKSASGF